MSKREATLMETAIAMAKHRKEHPGVNLIGNGRVKAYLKAVARGHIDGDDIDAEKDAIWGRMTVNERCIANAVVSAVFEDYL